jgi:hypothetical protein
MSGSQVACPAPTQPWSPLPRHHDTRSTTAIATTTDTRSRSTTDDHSEPPRPTISTETHFYLPQAEGRRELIVRRRPAAYTPAEGSRHAVETLGNEGRTAEMRRNGRAPPRSFELRVTAWRSRPDRVINSRFHSRNAHTTRDHFPDRVINSRDHSRNTESTPGSAPGLQGQLPVRLPDRAVNSRDHSRNAESTPGSTPGLQGQHPVRLPDRAVNSRDHSRSASSTPGSAPALRAHRVCRCSFIGLGAPRKHSNESAKRSMDVDFAASWSTQTGAD